jgi:acylphosphatase
VVRRRVVVSGEVQMVGFRWSCARAAERLGLAGWVRNLPTGDVEAVVAGAGEPVAAMLEWLRHGPRLARVDALEVRDEPVEHLTGFTVER